jgi:hypothetical protein
MYSKKIVQILTDKYKRQTQLSNEDIFQVIYRFHQIKESSYVESKDITRYSWDDLRDLIISFQLKQIHYNIITRKRYNNLIYNENKLRVYYTPNKFASIQYGTGYNFCISARSSRNRFDWYKNDSSIYFVFDDRLSNEKLGKNLYKDPNHLYVVLTYKNSTIEVYNANNQLINGGNYNLSGIPRLMDIGYIFGYEESESDESKLKIEYDRKVKKLSTEYGLHTIDNAEKGIKTTKEYYGKDFLIIELNHKDSWSSARYIIHTDMKIRRVGYCKMSFLTGKIKDKDIPYQMKNVKVNELPDEYGKKYIKELKIMVTEYLDSLMLITLENQHPHQIL